MKALVFSVDDSNMTSFVNYAEIRRRNCSKRKMQLDLGSFPAGSGQMMFLLFF
jgi:hypothetical protein